MRFPKPLPAVLILRVLLLLCLGGGLLPGALPSAEAQGNPFLSAPEPEENQGFLQRFIQKPSALAGAGGLQAWSVKLQRTLREILTRAFPSEENPRRGGPSMALVLLGIPFLYGMLHAAGPGHRKTVVFAWFAGRPARPIQAAGAGFFFALLHGGTAIALVLIARQVIQRALTRHLDQASLYMEFFSYLALILLGSILLVMDLRSRRRSLKGDTSPAAEGGGENRGLWALLFFSGLVPCPGAVIILLFAMTQGFVLWGVAAALSMSLGMGVTLTLIGLLSLGGRELVMKMIPGEEAEEKRRRMARLGGVLSLLSFALIILFGLFMILPYCNWAALAA